jgi:transposase
MSCEEKEEEQKKEPSGRILYRAVERGQMGWVVRDWESMLAPDHTARAIWELAGRLDWSEFEKTIRSREQAGGRPVWEPRLLASVWMYAYTLGVGSARAVERMQVYEPGLQWLTAGEIINHHTLSDFRITETKKLERLFSQVLAVLDQDGLIDLSVVMQDGTKISAVAGKQSLHRRKTLEEHLEQAQAVVAELGQQCQSESQEQTETGVQRRARERVARLEQALEVLGQREQAAAKRDRAQVRASESEPETRKMKHADGGWSPSYNVQIVTEASHQVVVGITVTDEGNDAQQLVGGVELVEQNLARKPATMVADGGYASRHKRGADGEPASGVGGSVEEPGGAAESGAEQAWHPGRLRFGRICGPGRGAALPQPKAADVSGRAHLAWPAPSCVSSQGGRLCGLLA